MEKNNYVAITYTTNGYVDFTHNLLSSIEKNNIDMKIQVFSLDKKASDYFKRNGIETIDFKSKYIESQDDMFFQNSDNFGYLMMAKFEIIYKELLENDYVLYIDGDVVIKKDIMRYLFAVRRNYDIIFQDDKRPSKPNQINLCAGFMFIKSNKKTLKFFNPENLNPKKIASYKTHDQTHINKNKNKFNYGVLSLDMFPNGAHYYENYKSLNPSIVHFNYVIGKEKINTIKKYNEWYLDN
ncbi:MAG: hypothetical protein CMB83_00900 [Flammeovirgaceae bacterium]|nr:hypothetical protein [Flammeovirgaceae bacterium]|tara:strand:- start:552 stop:1268 length:717 start_codon:yes stop_codon:yes gene_type:complete